MSWRPKLLSQRVAALSRDLRARETELLCAVLVAPGSYRVRELQLRVAAQQEELAKHLERLWWLEAAAANAAPRARRARRHTIAQGTSDQDIERARAAMRRQGMLPR